nr:immunoglobulin heavy chain junction region [Macaca mulatta]
CARRVIPYYFDYG